MKSSQKGFGFCTLSCQTKIYGSPLCIQYSRVLTPLLGKDRYQSGRCQMVENYSRINMPIYMYIYNLLKFTQKANCVTVEKYQATAVLARQQGLFGKFSIGRFSFQHIIFANIYHLNCLSTMVHVFAPQPSHNTSTPNPQPL